MNYYIVNKNTREWISHLAWDGKGDAPKAPEGYELVPESSLKDPVREIDQVALEAEKVKVEDHQSCIKELKASIESDEAWESADKDALLRKLISILP